MSIRTVVVCEAQVPFVHGGAEVHVRELTRELVARGYRTELVSVPFKWYPKDEILPHAAAWRLIDLSESNGQPIDLVIASKFPTYFVRHPNKVAWLIHQYRAAYELCGTPYSDFGHTEQDVERRAAELGVTDRIAFLGTVDYDALVDLYRDALAVVYPPYDEDFGYVTLEAFLARKPVVTATDSGGPNEFVADGVNGFVCAPEPDAIAAAINRLAADRQRARSLGDAGYDRARTITWDGVIEKLTGTIECPL